MQKKIKTGMLYRRFELKNNSIDKEKRTVELSFSSEAPVKQSFGYEILSHAERAVRLDRLNQGAPLLLNHNQNEQLGVADRAYIGPDRKGRALVRFSRSTRAEEIFQDVIDEIRKNVSVGYLIHSMRLLETKEGDDDSYFIDDWEPYEISILPVAADLSVGVDRAAEFKDFETIIHQGEEPCLKNSIRRSPEDIIRDSSILTATREIAELAGLRLPLK